MDFKRLWKICGVDPEELEPSQKRNVEGILAFEHVLRSKDSETGEPVFILAPQLKETILANAGITPEEVRARIAKVLMDELGEGDTSGLPGLAGNAEGGSDEQ